MIQETVKDKLGSARGFDTDDILGALGLQRRRSQVEVLVPAAAIFATGALIGAGAALLFAPQAGRETRRQLRSKANRLSERLESSAGEMIHGADAARRSENGGRPERKTPEHEGRLPPNGPGK